MQLQSLGDTAQRMSARMQGGPAASMVPSSASEASDEAPEVKLDRMFCCHALLWRLLCGCTGHLRLFIWAAGSS